MSQSTQFSPSDPWLLQAIGMAGRTSPASLRDIVAVGDYVNHAIFTWEEVQTGLPRLIAARLIEAEGKGFRLSQMFVHEYARLTANTSVVFHGEALKAYLQKLPFPEMKDSVFLPVTQVDFETTVKEYYQEMNHAKTRAKGKNNQPT
jgi:hypothetical protein